MYVRIIYYIKRNLQKLQLSTQEMELIVSLKQKDTLILHKEKFL